MLNGYSKEFRQVMQANMHPTIDEAQKYGVHFEYNDICRRLRELQFAQQHNNLVPTAVQYWTQESQFMKINLNTQKTQGQVPALKLNLINDFDNAPGSVTNRNRPKSTQRLGQHTTSFKNASKISKDLSPKSNKTREHNGIKHSLTKDTDDFKQNLSHLRKEVELATQRLQSQSKSSQKNNFKKIMQEYQDNLKRSISNEKTKTFMPSKTVDRAKLVKQLQNQNKIQSKRTPRQTKVNQELIQNKRSIEKHYSLPKKVETPKKSIATQKSPQKQTQEAVKQNSISQKLLRLSNETPRFSQVYKLQSPNPKVTTASQYNRSKTPNDYKIKVKVMGSRDKDFLDMLSRDLMELKKKYIS